MGIRIQTGTSTYTELTGTKGLFVQTGAATYNRAEAVYIQTGASTFVLVYQFDNAGPAVPIPTRATTGSMNANNQTDTVSWGAITDAGSGVASATVYQTFTGSTSGVVAGATHPTTGSLSTFAAGNTTFAIPTNRRQGDTGETWTVSYYIVAADVAGNSTTGTASTAAATLRYDITNPVVPTPTAVATNGTTDTVSWGAITDAGSGVASATVYQLYYGSTSGYVAGTAHPTSGSLASFGAGSTTFAIPTNRRNTPTGETWQVSYYIIAIDNAGNSTTGVTAVNHYTKPLGDYSFRPTGADARNIGNTAWLSHTTSDEGMVGFSTTKLYGAWFYGSTAFSNKTLGWSPDSGSIWLQRAGAAQTNRGNSGTFTIRAHSSPTKSGALSFTGSITSSISGNDGTGQPALSAAQLTALGNGTVYGFALTGHSTTVAFLRGLTVSTNNNPYGVYSGTVFLTYT